MLLARDDLVRSVRFTWQYMKQYVIEDVQDREKQGLPEDQGDQQARLSSRRNRDYPMHWIRCHREPILQYVLDAC